MTAKPSTLRKRNMTAAKRSLGLILEAAQQHLALLEEGTVPESAFTVYVTKYDAALNVLHALDALGEDSDGEGVVVDRMGLTAMVVLLRASDVGYAIQDAEEGSPLGDILAITGTGEPSGD